MFGSNGSGNGLMGLFIFLFFLVLLILLAWIWFWNQGQGKRNVNLRGVAQNTGLIERYWLDRITYLRMLWIEQVASSSATNETITQIVNIRGQISQGYRLTFGERAGKSVDQYLEAKDKTIASIFKSIQLNLPYDSQVQTLGTINDGLADALTKPIGANADKNVVKKYLQDTDDATIQQAVLYVRRDYKGSMAAFDKGRASAAEMNKYLSGLIINQAVSLSSVGSVV